MLTLSTTTSPNKLFDYDCMTYINCTIQGNTCFFVVRIAIHKVKNKLKLANYLVNLAGIAL